MIKMCTNYTWVYRLVSANQHLQICCLILVQSLEGDGKFAFAIVFGVLFIFCCVLCLLNKTLSR